MSIFTFSFAISKGIDLVPFSYYKIHCYYTSLVEQFPTHVHLGCFHKEDWHMIQWLNHGLGCWHLRVLEFLASAWPKSGYLVLLCVLSLSLSRALSLPVLLHLSTKELF